MQKHLLRCAQTEFSRNKNRFLPMELVFESVAYFKFLDYQISHKQLLIRGEKASNGENIDIVLEGVAFLHCPTSFEGLTIYSLDEATSAEKGITTLPFTRNFLFVSEMKEFYVQTAVLRIYRNSLSHNESSIDMTGRGQENLLRFG